eukprot:CAMPEP_0180109582 /NCGR_PEP_ID=MMETSP0985-20121206/34563_1 /TAXON_ID=483367 /ORGANISM="non described non described, Strain CCMP 2436" /LENGTH=35 /DNA_ID= /DNA_START= /DNA_END= /DNA_ORIENTATION=
MTPRLGMADPVRLAIRRSVYCHALHVESVKYSPRP